MFFIINVLMSNGPENFTLHLSFPDWHKIAKWPLSANQKAGFSKPNPSLYSKDLFRGLLLGLDEVDSLSQASTLKIFFQHSKLSGDEEPVSISLPDVAVAEAAALSQVRISSHQTLNSKHLY